MLVVMVVATGIEAKQKEASRRNRMERGGGGGGWRRRLVVRFEGDKEPVMVRAAEARTKEVVGC